jgi:hypothetical protein
MITQTNKTIPAAVALDKSKPDFRLDVVLAILLIVTIFSIPGGGAIHCLAGASLIVGCAIHLAQHGRWIKAVVLNNPKNPAPTVLRNRRLFLGLLVSLIVCGLSGPVNLVFSHGPAHLLFLPLVCFLGRVHGLSGVVFLGLCLVHLLLHRKWIMKKIGRRRTLDIHAE